MGTIRKISLTIVETAKLLWRRLLWIAAYSLALAVLWQVGVYAYTQYDMNRVRQAPASDYLKYTSLTTNNIREGEDLTYTVCRDFVGRYDVSGKRIIYVIPPGKAPRDRIFETALPYKGTIEGTPCQSYKITATNYHLKPGSYQLTLSGTFNVDYGIEKSYYIAGDVLTVYAQPAGSGDLQAQLNNLQQQVEELQRRFGVSPTSTDVPVVDSGTSVVMANPTTQAAPQQSQPVQQPSPTPSPSQPGLINRLLNGVGGLLGGLL